MGSEKLPGIIEHIDSNPIDSVDFQSILKNFKKENRRFWRLGDILPNEAEKLRSSAYFRLENETWRFFIDTRTYHFDTDSFIISINNLFNDAAVDLFSVRMGIVSESGDEISAAKVEISSGNVHACNFIRRSKLEWLKQSSEKYFFFVDITRKDGETGKEVPKRKLHDFKNLFLSGKYSDFTINVKNTQFKVHRLILGARSPVFSELMRYEWQWMEKSKRVLSIYDTDPVIFQQFLLYMYSGNVEHLTWDNIAEIRKLAEKYSVHDLEEFCMERRKITLSAEKFENFLLSQQSDCSELSAGGIQPFQGDLKEIIKNEKILELIIVNPGKAYVMIKFLNDLMNY